MDKQDFEYSNVFKSVLSTKGDLKLKLEDLWSEYKSAWSHSLKEFHSVLKIILESEFGVTFFQKKTKDLLEVFDTVNDHGDQALDILDEISMIAKNGDTFVANAIREFLNSRYGDSARLKNALDIAKFYSGETTGVVSLVNLIMHVQPGSFVYHHNGWGVGEIKSVDILKGSAKVDFEGSEFTVDTLLRGLKGSTSIMPSDHFLVERFKYPDEMEEKALKDPESVLIKAIKDVGALSSQGVTLLFKDAVISSKKWKSWIAKARAIVKSSDKIIVGSDKRWSLCKADETKNPPISSLAAIEKQASSVLSNANLHNDPQFIETTRKIIESILESDIEKDSKILAMIYADYCGIPQENLVDLIVESKEDSFKAFASIQKIQIKKRVSNILSETAEGIELLKEFFVNSLAKGYRNDIRLVLLSAGEWKEFYESQVDDVINGAEGDSELKSWILRKMLQDAACKISTMEVLSRIVKLMSRISKIESEKPIIKKLATMIRKDHYKVVRMAFENSNSENVRDFLVLAEQCSEFVSSQTNDVKVMRSIANVVFPGNFGTKESKDIEKDPCVWTTREGLERAREKVKKIMSVELSENTQDIKKARAYGDLRENAEYSSAIDKRRELQSVANKLLNMIKYAKCIEDFSVDVNKVSVGCEVVLSDSAGKSIKYSILGPWDVRDKKNSEVISYDTGVAKTLISKGKGEEVRIGGKTYKVSDISVSSMLAQV